MQLVVLSLRYSSWSMRPWIALHHAGASFETKTVQPDIQKQESVGGVVESIIPDLEYRREQGSVTGLFPVLHVDGVVIHEALAISEYAAEQFPKAKLWPTDTLQRAQARSLSAEMASGFPNLREHLSCHPFARVPDYQPTAGTKREINRVFEIWSDCLSRSKGPFLFGDFSIVDCMYFPVVTRFATYGVELSEQLKTYADAMWSHHSVRAWKQEALKGPRLPAYDQKVIDLGGDPDATAKL